MSRNGIRFGTSRPPLAACVFLSPFLKTSLCFLFSVTLLRFSFELQTTIRFSNSFCVSNGTDGHFVPLTTFCSFWNFSKSTQSMESFASISFFLLSDERALCFHSCTCVKESTKLMQTGYTKNKRLQHISLRNGIRKHGPKRLLNLTINFILHHCVEIGFENQNARRDLSRNLVKPAVLPSLPSPVLASPAFGTIVLSQL